MLVFPLFLRGVLENVVCRTWFFDGNNVVNCGNNVVLKCSFWAVENYATFFNYFFSERFGRQERRCDLALQLWQGNNPVRSFERSACLWSGCCMRLLLVRFISG